MSKSIGLRSIVIINLQNPREKLWGALLSVNAFGLTLRGIDINSFDDWSRSIANQTESLGLSTMFIPMMRVEKVILDETAGQYKSLSDQFYDRVGHDVRDFLGIPEGLDDELLN